MKKEITKDVIILGIAVLALVCASVNLNLTLNVLNKENQE